MSDPQEIDIKSEDYWQVQVLSPAIGSNAFYWDGIKNENDKRNLTESEAKDLFLKAQQVFVGESIRLVRYSITVIEEVKP